MTLEIGKKYIVTWPNGESQKGILLYRDENCCLLFKDEYFRPFTVNADTFGMRYLNVGTYERWINFYPEAAYKNREDADRFSLRGRIACVKVKFEEGEGL